MNKRRTPPNGHGHEQPNLAASLGPHVEREPAALMDIVVANGIDGEAGDPAAGGDGPIPPELAAGEGEIGNTLQTYLREIRRAPLLTPQEEFDTATRARLGDFQARQAMIEHNLRL